MATINIKLKTYDELQFEVMTLTTNSYLKDLKIKELEKENKKLKAELDLLEDNRIYLNNKIDKAIEYIENCNHGIEEYKIYEITTTGVEELLDILKGGNNDK